MSTKYTNHFNTKKTPQNQSVPGKDQVRNSAGGFTFQIDKFQRLNRFLILGSEGGTYYVGENKLTRDNANSVVECIQEDGLRAVQTIVDVSLAGRAPKNDPAIFALALACTFGNNETKMAAYNAITSVCRIGTHLFQFVDSVKDLRGWSRGLRNGVSKFYTTKPVDKLALQLVKYRQRGGWTHRDVLRLAHVTPANLEQNRLLAWTAGKADPEVTIHALVEGFEKIQGLDSTDVKGAVSLINEYNLPREAVPTGFLKQKAVWEAMLPRMPITAMIRNLGKMTSAGVLNTNLDSTVKHVVETITDSEILKKGRMHPLVILNALRTYSSGAGFRGNLSWTPVPAVVDALDDAFYMAFGSVEPTGKNFLLGVDCSGSMDWKIDNSALTCRDVAAAMAMVAIRTEKYQHNMGFSSSGGYGFARRTQTLDGIADLGLSSKMRLDTVIQRMQQFRWGGTDCALPMIYAKAHNLPIDTFVVYTDNETWAGAIHPFQALKDYRQSSGRDAKLIVVGMTGTPFSIADPSDPGMLDIVGFDTAVPEVMNQFVRGNV